MAEVPFTVSARTARLIGRENVSSAFGAITELVKNCHDADSRKAWIIFDIKFDKILDSISKNEFNSNPDSKFLKKFYSFRADTWTLRNNLNKDEKEILENYFKSKNSILIVDNGQGMSEELVRTFWMTIGTDNKQVSSRSRLGRVQSGAKGIGRFALDRLGTVCQMYTQQEKQKDSLYWMVNWEQFDQPQAVIGEVKATLTRQKKMIGNYLEEFSDIFASEKNKFESGTILKIEGLRDWWTLDEIQKAYERLQSLVPASYRKEFSIFLQDLRDPGLFGEVVAEHSNDYDYHLYVKFDGKNSLTTELRRREFNHKRFPKAFFKAVEKSGLNAPFRKEDFEKESIKTKKTLAEHFGGSKLNEALFSGIGEFTCNLYFLKASATGKQDEKFYYKDAEYIQRRLWMENNAGIKLYRDNFRVRPYGEASGSAFDWLGLGERAAKSPAAPAHKSGDWRVRSHQVHGNVHLSRVTNVELMDKSSREGLVENSSFTHFRAFLVSLFGEIETDRQTIMRLLSDCWVDSDKGHQAILQANQMISKTSLHEKNGVDPEKKALVEAFKAQEDQIRILEDENKMMMRLASAGLSISSFAHEIKNVHSSITENTSSLEQQILAYIDLEKVKSIKAYEDPRILVQDLKDANRKVNTWIQFAMDSLQRDKRTRKLVDFERYFNDFQRSWHYVLEKRKVNFQFRNIGDEKISKRIFEMDLDSIFSNLLINSIAAFEGRRDGRSERTIKVSIGLQKKKSASWIIMDYEDSGPGLDKVIKNPNKIFEAKFTTKITESGEKIGTGLGMWIVKKMITDFEGEILVINPRPGFKIRISIPM